MTRERSYNPRVKTSRLAFTFHTLVQRQETEKYANMRLFVAFKGHNQQI
jgi:hypothetical protein